MMDVLSVTSEAYPLVKTGGLADVAGALPGALSSHGVSMRTLIPGYPAVTEAITDGRAVAQLPDLFGGPATLVAARAQGLDLVVIDAPHLYARAGGLYNDAEGRDWPDNWRRFAALGFVAAALADGLVTGYRPRIVHAHDWQGALAAAYIAFSDNRHTRTVVTIHNLAFQGQFGADIFAELGLPDSAFSIEGVEYYGGVGFLKAGLACAHAITTVSPSYASEIRTAPNGMGLEGLLTARAPDLVGILNGIDTRTWDPMGDEHLPAPYRQATLRRRIVNRAALETRFGIAPSAGPLFAVVSRLSWQKGTDLLVSVIDDLVAAGARLAVLGSGDLGLARDLAAAAARHPGAVGFIEGYDEALSHLVQAGADSIVVPSRFEPCGLTQLYGLRYGAVPLVARVGGLADTIIDANPAALQAGAATGLQFGPVDRAHFLDALDRAITLFGQPRVWSRMQRKGMKADVSWDRSAADYAALYRTLLGTQA